MLLQPMLARLAAARDLEEALRVALNDVVALHGTEMGNVQMLGEDGQLAIVEARGIGREFLRMFGRIPLDSHSICGRAVRHRKPVFVKDVNEDADFLEYREFAASVPFRSVLSCPLLTRSGELVGVVSAQSGHDFTPTALELSSLAAYATQLADTIATRLPAAQRARAAEQLARLLAERSN
jgi:GAF domain-containing protein